MDPCIIIAILLVTICSMVNENWNWSVVIQQCANSVANNRDLMDCIFLYIIIPHHLRTDIPAWNITSFIQTNHSALLLIQSHTIKNLMGLLQFYWRYAQCTLHGDTYCKYVRFPFICLKFNCTIENWMAKWYITLHLRCLKLNASLFDLLVISLMTAGTH